MIGAVFGGAVSWARNRLWKRKEEDPRPVEVNLYGPDNEVLRRVKISDPDQEPEELD